MKMIRTNEISGESLHRQGSLLQKQKDHHNAATLAFELRHPEAVTRFPLADWADAVAKVSDDIKVVQQFSFSEHKVLQDFKDDQLLAGRSLATGRSGMFKLVRQIFYRCDPYSMFPTFELVEGAIDAQNKAWKKTTSIGSTIPSRRW